MKDTIFKDMKDNMEKAIANLHHELGSLRTGRASITLLDKVKVDCYGTATPVNQLATLSVPDSKSIVIQPWDANILPNIEKAIMASELGLTPMNDGKVIRINIPPLTEERRKELVRTAKKMAEDTKIAIRSARRDANEGLKKIEKEKALSQDEFKKAQAQVQEITNKNTANVEKILSHKEKDIMEV
jgi:ribosome recycling factor